MNKAKLEELIAGLEIKIQTMPEDSQDILLTKSILQFILYLAEKELCKTEASALVATDDEIWSLSHNE